MRKKERKIKPVFDHDMMNLKDGMYVCAECGNQILVSEKKKDLISGWPISIKPIETGFITRLKPGTDKIETEIICSRCQCHLGRVINENTKPKGVRYCIESMALDFQENG